MMPVHVTGFRTYDGLMFDTRKEAEDHEKKLDKQIKIDEAKGRIREAFLTYANKEYHFRKAIEDLGNWEKDALDNVIVNFIYDNSELLLDLQAE